MASLFFKADASEYQADSAKLQSLLLACQQDLGHGVVEISYTPQDQTVLFIARNKVSDVYTIQPDGWKRHPAPDYKSQLQDAHSNVRILSLPLAGIRIGKILIEGMEREHTYNLPTSILKVHLNEWQRRSFATLSHIQWTGAEAFLVTPGSRMPVHTALFVSREQSLGEEKAIARAISWPEKDCEVTTYVDHKNTEAYQEFLLHLLFTKAMEIILKRYSDISGRRLANNMSESLDALAKTNHWQINSIDCQVTDDEIFPSPKAAFLAYQTLAGACYPEMEQVIGSKLASSILQETTNSLNQIDQEIMQKYPFLSSEKASYG